MKTLRECIEEASEGGYALGHFNISNLEGLHGIYNAAKKLNLPVIIGVSEGEQKFAGLEEVVALVRAIRERDSYPIFLNADHHSSFESVKACVNAGFDMVIIDVTKLPFEENVSITKKCVDYVKSFNEEHETDVLVEAELGYIGSGSDIKDSVPEGAGVLTTPEDAKKFVEETGVDLFAPSVGSIHGIIKSGKPHIDTELVKKIKEATGVPLVLHGGSGLRDEDFTNAIDAGICIVHINSELRLAYREEIEKTLQENPDEINPSKLLTPAVDEIEEIVEKRLKLFSKRG